MFQERCLPFLVASSDGIGGTDPATQEKENPPPNSPHPPREPPPPCGSPLLLTAVGLGMDAPLRYLPTSHKSLASFQKH